MGDHPRIITEIQSIDRSLTKLAQSRISAYDAREWLYTTEAIEALLDERIVWMRAREDSDDAT